MADLNLFMCCIALLVLNVDQGLGGAFDEIDPSTTPGPGRGSRCGEDIDIDRHSRLEVDDPYFLSDTTCCARNFDKWYHNLYPFDKPPSNQLEFQDFFQWDKICSRWRAAALCVYAVKPVPECTEEWSLHLLRNRSYLIYPWQDKLGPSPHYAFYDRTCMGDAIKPEIRKFLVSPELSPQCMSPREITAMQNCSRHTHEIYQSDRLHDISNDLRAHYDRLARAQFRCMRDIVTASRCNDVTREYFFHLVKLQLPSIINETTLDMQRDATVNFASETRCTIGVYGDPHLKMCNDSQLYTCSSQGRHFYFTNKYIQISGVNEYIGQRATTVRSLNAYFRRMNDSEIVGSYTARNGQLPVNFDNTHLNYIGTGMDRVVLTGMHYSQVQILHETLGVVLMIQHWGPHYFFTIRAADKLCQESYGLLITGCPANQLIGRGGVIEERRQRSRKKRSETRCYQVCQDVEDPAFRETCEFDCVVSRNPAISQMTKDAVKDVERVKRMDRAVIAKALYVSTTTTSTTTTTTAAPPPAVSATAPAPGQQGVDFTLYGALVGVAVSLFLILAAIGLYKYISIRRRRKKYEVKKRAQDKDRLKAEEDEKEKL
ncbi:uncharacterized protein LOC106166459 [Lingula anatina]|uniref:Uncharacterized protein LOC106166459 n=1 Tax=Lingula anatina TaxID=7574 RepID=A0A1S3IQJ6_LINAN|nr:uncharacterized protein LOC106166459 [Lingula anatina]|eukprot:XP_013400487.1 uncharacterized protein LOC106166459 [Lingula anatina]